MAWTEKQQQAIDIRNKGIIVSAAAGSGKTSVLVERLVRQLSDPNENIPADRMIIVTFTNAAAAQMRRRLMNEFSRQMADDPENLRLAEQYSKLETAKISTISSFCFDLIRDNIDSSDLPPDFRIMEETEEELTVREAVNDVFEDWYANRPEDMKLLNDMFCEADDMPLEELMTELLRFMSVLPFPEYSADRICEIFSETDPDKSVFGREYAEIVLAELAKTERTAKKAKTLADSFMNIESKAYLTLSEEFGVILSAADELRSGLAEKELSWDKIFSSPGVTAAREYTFSRLTVKTKKDDYDDSDVERLKALRDSYKDYLGKFKNLLISREDAADDLAVHSRIVPLLIELYRSVSECLWQKKLEKGAVSFSDGEQLAVRLLAEISPEGEIRRTELCRRISEFYKIIMIDEFQDVNDAQNMIFRLLSHNGSAEKAGDNIFCVGDVKQAIYGFRLANPAIFTDVLHDSEEYSDECKAKNVSVSLNKNFRSSGDVVDFVNYIFKRAMSEAVGGIDYTDSEALVCGAEYNDRPRLTEMIIAEPSAENNENKAVGENADTDEDEDDKQDMADLAAEAEAAAERISEMLISGAPVYENGADRPCTPKDFCILLRTKSDAEAFAASLSARGIKSVSESSPAYLDSWEISVMLNLLRVVDNPLVDIPVLSVLMSPMFGFTAGDIAEMESFVRRIRPNGGDPVYVKLNLLLSSYHRAGWELFAKAEEFMQTVVSLRQYISRAGVWELVTHIYNSTAFMAVMQASGNGKQKCANLRLLTEYIKSYEASSGGGLSGFLRYIDNLRSHKKDLASAATVSASADAVQIYTIHKSKGLEFPFVFLCRGTKGFNKQDLKRQTVFDRKLGIAFQIRRRETLQKYPTVPFSVLKKRKERELISEEMRLLYVALTRAKERLFITVPEGDKLDIILGKCEEYAVSGYSEAASAGCFADWIFGTLSEHEDFSAMYKNAVTPKLFSVSRIKCGGTTEENIPEESKAAMPDANIVENIRKCCAFRYDSSRSELAAKLTVTEIAKSEQKVVLSDSIFDLPDSPKKISAAERGTAHHTFMQYADFALAERDIEAAILSVCDMGYISEEEAAELDRGLLNSFFESELYSRLKRSPKIMREKKFLVKISDLSLDDELGKVYNQTNGMLQGIADALFFEDDGVVLIDYKTDRGVTEKVLRDRYGMQLRLYSAALGLILGTPVKEAFVYSFSLSKEILISASFPAEGGERST